MRILKNLFLFLMMIALGVGGFMFLQKKREPVEHEAARMTPRPVEVMRVERKPFKASVKAYGNVEPAEVLQMRSQVSGEISYVHPDLKRGGSIPAGEVVVRIDPEDYESSLSQSQADVEASRSQLAQLQQEEANLRESLQIAQQNLRLAQANLQNVKRQDAPVQQNTAHIKRNLNLARQNLRITQENLQLARKEQQRIDSLAKRRLIPLNQADSQQQQVLQLEQQVVQQQQSIVQMEQELTRQDQSIAQQDQNVLQQEQQIVQQQQQVTELEGQLRTFKSRRANAEAQLRRVQQQLRNQQTTLARTEVVMPFDGRISSVEAKEDGFVSVGGLLFEADNTDGVEIRAEVPLSHLRGLVAQLDGQRLDFTANKAAELLARLNLSAEVRLAGSDEQAVWPAHVARLSEDVDPVKQTLGIVVAVDNPYENIELDKRPPLFKGMYVEVRLIAPPTRAVVIPRSTVHQGRVYVVGEDNKLVIRPIDVRFQEGEDVVVAQGLREGEQLIVNDLVPVIPNMPLDPLPSLADQAPQPASETLDVSAADKE